MPLIGLLGALFAQLFRERSPSFSLLRRGRSQPSDAFGYCTFLVSGKMGFHGLYQGFIFSVTTGQSLVC